MFSHVRPSLACASPRTDLEWSPQECTLSVSTDSVSNNLELVFIIIIIIIIFIIIIIITIIIIIIQNIVMSTTTTNVV